MGNEHGGAESALTAQEEVAFLRGFEEVNLPRKCCA
jgi:hypothetical protein